MIPVFDQNLDKEATLRDIFIYLTAPTAYDQRGVDAGEALDDQTCYMCRGDNSITEATTAAFSASQAARPHFTTHPTSYLLARP